MKIRSLVSLIIAVVAVSVLCAGGLGGLFGGGTAAGACFPIYLPSTSSTAASPPSMPSIWPAIGEWNGEQAANAAAIVTTGAQLGVPARGWVIAVATAMQESSLRNLPGGDRDSVGLFQQRPSQGWGTPAQLQDPVYAAGKFYAKLITISGWQTMPLTEAAQAVQISAYPDAYAKWDGRATELVTAVASTQGWTIPEDLEQCVSTVGWTAPVRAPIVSGFRTAQRPGHDGVDLGAPSETPIRAATAGEVITARCDTDPSGRLCNRTGSPSTPGCGWYVKIRHTGDVVTMYCHLIRAPMVRVGQMVAVGEEIGRVGSSGHSSGPHLHFEVHRIEGGTTRVVDPVVFMRQQGVVLGS